MKSAKRGVLLRDCQDIRGNPLVEYWWNKGAKVTNLQEYSGRPGYWYCDVEDTRPGYNSGHICIPFRWVKVLEVLE